MRLTTRSEKVNMNRVINWTEHHHIAAFLVLTLAITPGAWVHLGRGHQAAAKYVAAPGLHSNLYRSAMYTVSHLFMSVARGEMVANVS